MKKILFAGFFLFLSLTVLSAHAVQIQIVTTANGEAAQSLVKLLNGFGTFKANFVERRLLHKNGAATQKTLSGQIAIKRPGKFFWQVSGAQSQLIVADGKYLWVYDKDLEQATKRKLDLNRADSPAQFLAGTPRNLLNSFTVRRIITLGFDDAFELRPKGANELYQAIRIYFVHGALSRMQLADNLGESTIIDFSNVQTNLPFYPALFTFTPPPGTDIIAE